jgi:hypothetical protein
MTEYSDSTSSEQPEFKVAPCQPSSSSSTSDTINRGRAAWARLREGYCWTDWRCVAKALAIGHSTALREAATNNPHGARYRKAISIWLRCYGFDTIHKTDRSRLLKCWNNIAEIDVWWRGLPPEKQQQCNHPRVVLRHWQKSLGASPSPRPKKPAADLTAAWKAATPEQRAAALAKLAVPELLALLSEEVITALSERVVGLGTASAASSSSLAITLTGVLQKALSILKAADATDAAAKARAEHEAVAALTGINARLKSSGRDFHDAIISIATTVRAKARRRAA